MQLQRQAAGGKLGVFPPETTYVNLKAGKFGVPCEQAHVRIVKKTAPQVTYTIEAVNGTRLAQFSGITDFTANGGRNRLRHALHLTAPLAHDPEKRAAAFGQDHAQTKR